jgi:hypothetical protein
MNNALTLSPEAIERREQLAELGKEYAALYTEKDYKLSQEREFLYTRYINTIGKELYYEFCLSVEVSELKLKVELAQAAINRGERPNRAEIERLVREQFKEYYEQIKQQAAELEEAQKVSLISDETIKELKQLYRMLVKRLHPDLHPHQSDYYNDLFLQVQTAYRTLNLPLLRQIALKLELEDMDEEEDIIITENTSVYIETLQRLIAELKDDIERLEQTFPFIHRQLLNDPEQLAHELKIIEEMCQQFEAEKKIYEERYLLMIE